MTTTPTPHHVAAAVHAILGGSDPRSVATAASIDLDDLLDAAQLYQVAGQAALEQHTERDWYQVRVRFPDWAAAETIGAHHLGPALDDLQQEGHIIAWWFLRKHPCWRLRMRMNDTPTATAAVNDVLDMLTTTGTLTAWRPNIYEPETHAFGGARGIDVIHDLFCADTQAVLSYLRNPPRLNSIPLGRRELSILLLNALMHAAQLDTFERGDVFARLTQYRPTPREADTSKITRLTTQLEPLLAAPDDAIRELLSSRGMGPHTLRWLTAYEEAGHQFGRAAANGSLHRGLRAITTHITIFHWNRLGLSATTQALLAQAATAAVLPTE